MIVGLLQFELLVHGATSLKDKRRVVQSVKDRLHREYLCAVAEIGRHDSHTVARLGLAVVGHEGRRVGETLDAIVNKLRDLRTAELGDVSREILHGRGGHEDDPDDQPGFPRDADLDDALRRRAAAEGEAA